MLPLAMLSLMAIVGCNNDDDAPDKHTDEPPDTDTDVPPGVDPCNGIDDDGDGEIDEDIDLLWYPDADADGLGVSWEGEQTCEPEDGWVVVGGDCDDTTADLTGPVGEIHFVYASEEHGITAATGEYTWDGICPYDPDAGGAAVGDIDGDGDLDLFVPRQVSTDLLLVNDGTGHFDPAPGWVPTSSGSNGALFVDVDADRDLDLVVTPMMDFPTRLYVNDGSGVFVEDGVARLGLTIEPGVCQVQMGASAADFDLDGDLDLFIAGWQEELLVGDRQRSFLMENDGTGTFTDVSATTGIDALLERAVFTGMFHDGDLDGDPDLHVIADWSGSGLFLNDGGVFTETFARGTFTDENGMGADLADIDGDGDLDWFVTSIWDTDVNCEGGQHGCTGNRLYVDQGGGDYVDGTDAAGVREGQWGWGTTFLDHDLDGDVDLAMTGGFVTTGFFTEPGRFWRNRGDGSFDDITCESGFVDRGQGRALVPIDVDRDGDQDLVNIRLGETPSLWEARGAEGKGWLVVELDQPGMNRFGIGSMVTIVDGGLTQVRLLHANASFVGGRPPEVHFGLGDDTGPVDEVRVRWPDGVESVFTGVGPGLVRLAR